MTVFFTSAYNEAADLIKHYGMKKLTEIKKRQVFKSENEILVICGTGAINASVSVACVAQMFDIGENDIIISIGINPGGVEYDAGDIVLCNKLTDLAAERDFYPDILFKHPFKEGELSSRASNRKPSGDMCLTDTEGAFVYQAAEFFVPSCNIFIFKLIANANQEENDINGQISVVADWLKRIEKIRAGNERDCEVGEFSHIYVEEAAFAYELTEDVLNKYPDSTIIRIKHYKDVFCKKGQSFLQQKGNPMLVLAVNADKKLREGSPMCDSFGHENFYYSTHVMNCLYNCEYCYLQGMYASANVVIFVNFQDVADEAERILKEKSLYLCISYDGDLLMFEGLTGFVRKWAEFAAKHKNLEIELRTKSTEFEMIKDIEPLDNFVISWTLSPQEFAGRFELGTPSLESRKKSVAYAMSLGWRVRICIDPMICADGCYEVYKSFFADIRDFISRHGHADLSIGVFRAPVKYIRKMKRLRPDSEILCYEFVNGTYSQEDTELLLSCAFYEAL